MHALATCAAAVALAAFLALGPTLSPTTPEPEPEPMRLGAFSVSLVRADHSAGLGEAGVTVPVGNANGAIVKAPGEKTLWHMGDTDIFSDMALIAELHGVEICICPIGDRFTMGAKTAAST